MIWQAPENAEKPVIFLLGPTAAGKTDLALHLQAQENCEIVSVDSAQIYRGMDIGTAKPSKEILKNIPHHLVDIKEPTEVYSASDFTCDARRLIKDIHARGKTPLLTGGTMMYCRALLFGMAPMPKASPEVREQLRQQLEESSHEQMHARLQKIDPIAAAGIPPQNTQRMLRALEVYELTGKPISEIWKQTQADFPWPCWQLVVEPAERAQLHARINQRFDIMLEQGFEAEVQALMARGDLNEDMPSIKCVGYRQMWHYLGGKIDYDEMVERAKAASRQLGKRQLTWLRGWPGLQRLETGHPDLLAQALKLLQQPPSKVEVMKK